MTTLSHADILSSPIAFVGAQDFDHREGGLSPRRLPAWTRPQVPDLMDFMCRIPAGVRLAFETNAHSISLSVQTTTTMTPPAKRRPVVFDLLIDGDIVSQSSDRGNCIVLDRSDPLNVRIERADPYTVTFEGLGDHTKQCEIWLPHNALVEIRAIAFTKGASLGPPAPLQHRWVHYGSSISHCMEANQPTGTWPAVAAHQAGMSLLGLGFGGQCHLDQFVARTIRDMDADFISLKPGINLVNMDSMRERVFVPALHGFLDTIRERKPDVPILLISPIFCPSAEQQPGPTLPNDDGKFVTLTGFEEIQGGCLTLSRIRSLMEEITMARKDPHLGYLSGLELFGENDAHDLPDDLHPSSDGYRRMGDRFAARVFSHGGHLDQIR